MTCDRRILLGANRDPFGIFTRIFSFTDLPNFVLIGFPAPESGNPLLIPLAGHELGHTVWKGRSLASKYKKSIEDTILSLIELNIPCAPK